MSTSDQLSNTFLGYLNLDMSNHSYPPFPDLYDYITPPSPSVSYTLPMMPTPISSRLAPPPTPILAPQTVPDPLSPPPFPPPLVLSFRKPDGNFYWQCRDKKQNTPAFNQLQLKQFRIISDYHSNEVLRIHLRCVYGLPFIHLTDVIDAWTELKAVIWTCCPTQAMSKYITYFEENWIFSSSCPPSLWNCCAATLDGDPQTNNASERGNNTQTRNNFEQSLHLVLRANYPGIKF